MSTQYKSSIDVPTEILTARLNELADVVARKRDRIGAEFTMRIPAECDRDADLVMSEAAVRLESLQAECEKLRKDVKGLVEALESLLEVQDEDCRYDHEGYCQSHNLDHVDDGCRVARAKTALAAHRKGDDS